MIFTRLGKKEILANNRGGTIHDAVQDQPYISVPKNSEFQSGSTVVKKGNTEKNPMQGLCALQGIILLALR